MPETDTTPLGRLKARVYDVLDNRTKLQSIAPIGNLSASDSAILTAISAAADQYQEEAAFELAQVAMDGVAATLLAVYKNGLPEGAKLQNPVIDELAHVLANTGKTGREAKEPE